MKTIILASGSPRRKELLEKLGIKFEVEPSGFEETVVPSLMPDELVKQLSAGKAKNIASKHQNALVIGADTIVSFKNTVLGKPQTKEKAKEMLRALSGNVHSVFTGFTIIDTDSGKIISKAVETKVHFRKLTDQEIDNYVNTDEPLDKAGAYAIQGIGALLVEKIDGDCNNVVGLPLAELAISLRDFGINIIYPCEPN